MAPGSDLDRGVQQAGVVTELLQGGDAGQVCVGLSGALQAGPEHAVAEQLLVQLCLQGRGAAEQRPVVARRQVAVDDLLGAAQDEHASEAGQLCGSLLP